MCLIERGVCTDVIVRAYRGIGVDLQAPRPTGTCTRPLALIRSSGGFRTPDFNIHHRRVPNLAAFFKRHGQDSAGDEKRRFDYKPGDIVAWKLDDGRPHIGLVSDRQSGGMPLVVHNIGQGAQVENTLFAFTVTGHYRYGLEGN